ncbi:MAG: hypothetical protein R2911_34540 [Caldilineaceae bacterium]
MHNVQKSSGYAALIQAAAFILSPINFVLLLPSLGIDPTALPDPAAYLPVLNSPLLYVGSLIQFVLAGTVVLIALALHEGAANGESLGGRWAVAAAITGSTLLLITALLNVVALRVLGSAPAADQAAILLTAKVVGDALLAAAFVAVGWSFVLTGWAALQQANLPRGLALLMLVGGAAAILTFVLPQLRPLTALFNLVWSTWLGAKFLRAPIAGRAALATS